MAGPAGGEARVSHRTVCGRRTASWRRVLAEGFVVESCRLAMRIGAARGGRIDQPPQGSRGSGRATVARGSKSKRGSRRSRRGEQKPHHADAGECRRRPEEQHGNAMESSGFACVRKNER
jgi:hypothetical protein